MRALARSTAQRAASSSALALALGSSKARFGAAVARAAAGSQAASRARHQWFALDGRRHFAASGEGSKSSAADPYKGRLLVEGDKLPIADVTVNDETITSIEARLESRSQTKSSSQKLMEQQEPAGMFGKEPEDRVEDKYKRYQVEGSSQHLDEFQKVFRRLRSAGRKPIGEDRDVSDAILSALHYKAKRQTKGKK